jgi:hypothetical protein
MELPCCSDAYILSHVETCQILYSIEKYNPLDVEFYPTNITILWSVIIDGIWFDDHIYWTPWLHFTVHYYIHTLVSTGMTLLPLIGSGFQRRAVPSLSYHLPIATAHNNQTAAVLSLTHQPSRCNKAKDKVTHMLWRTVSQPICLGVKLPSGAQDHVFITARQ